MGLRLFATSALFFCLPAYIPAFADDTPKGESIIWRDPGDVAAMNLADGPWGKDLAPQPPFTFISEDTSGTSPKVKVRDAKGAEYTVKFGVESRPSAFSARLVAAVGYIVEPNFFLYNGRIEGARGLSRAGSYIKSDGRFENGRFELRSKDMKYMDDSAWKWTDNPFLGTKELSGLKIMVMLLSDWDDKDARNKKRGANTATFQMTVNGQNVIGYSVDDWGRTLGKWGGILEHTTWDCKGYTAQTPDFVQGVDRGIVRFGYRGTHNEVAEGIRVEDVQWLLQYLGRITDEQLNQAFDATGAKPDDTNCFGNHIRARIDALVNLVTNYRVSAQLH